MACTTALVPMVMASVYSGFIDRQLIFNQSCTAQKQSDSVGADLTSSRATYVIVVRVLCVADPERAYDVSDRGHVQGEHQRFKHRTLWTHVRKR